MNGRLAHYSEQLHEQAGRHQYLRADELVERDGLHFASVKVGSDRLELWRNDRIVKSIRIGPSTSFVTLTGFKDHYAFVDGEVRTELYFPH